MTVLEIEGKVRREKNRYYPVDIDKKNQGISPEGEKARRKLEKFLKHLIDARINLEKLKHEREQSPKEIREVAKEYAKEIFEEVQIFLNPLEKGRGKPYNLVERVKNLEGEMGDIVREIQKVKGTLGKVDEKLGKMDEKLGKVDEKLEKMDEKLGKMDEKLERIDKKLDKLDNIEYTLKEMNRTLGEIGNTLGIAPEGSGREKLIAYIEDKGERVKRLWESTKRHKDRPDVVIKTDKGIYILEAKHRIEGKYGPEKVIEQLKRGEKMIKEGKVGNLKVKKREKVFWVVYTYQITPTALKILEDMGKELGKRIVVLYEGKEAL